jgi:hypothetical protein
MAGVTSEQILAVHASVVGDQFWPTAALVIPVLALAVIVEARFTANREWPDAPRWYRRIQGVLWSATLIFSTLVEVTAFTVLAGYARSTSAWVYTAIYTVGQNLGVLLITPAGELLVRSNARAVARAMFASSTLSQRWQMFRISREIRRQLRDQRRVRDEEVPAMVKELDADEQLLSTQDDRKSRELLARIRAQREKLSKVSERINEGIWIREDQQALLTDVRKQTTDQIRDLLSRMESKLVRGDFAAKELDDIRPLPDSKQAELRSRIEDLSKRIEHLSKPLDDRA